MIKQTRYALRILLKYKLYTGISLMGLGIAISAIWFITNFVKNSYQYDAFHENSDRIYRLTMEVTAGGSTDHYATTGKPLGSLMSKEYTGIGAYAKMVFRNPVVKINRNVFKEDGFFNINPETLDVFSFDFIRGNKMTCFSAPNSIVLSKSLAKKYFNALDILGKQIMVDGDQYTVSGVFDDWPANSHLNLNALLSLQDDNTNYEAQDWFDLEQYNYVLLDPGNDQSDLNSKLEQLTNQHLNPILEGAGIDVTLHSQPLNALYFTPALIDDVPKGNPVYVNALIFAGILVLLIAGLNYINLSLTQSTQRSKEILLKKILGVSRRQLLIQSGLESFVMTLLVLLISAILIFAFDKAYFDYTGFTSINITDNWLLLLSIFLITFFFGLLGTSYSGTYLSFSSKLLNREGGTVRIFKKGLLGFQFAIASVILIVTLTMNRQIDFMKNKDLGFSKDQVLIVNLPDDEESKNSRIQFREQIRDFASIRNASLIGGGALPGEDNGKEIFEVMINGNKTERIYNLYRIDENYAEVLNIEFASGRNFQSNRISDQNDAVIINESLAKSLNWQNPLGKKIWCYNKQREVIGVVKNFHNKSLHNIIEPIVFMLDTNYSTNLLVKGQSSDADIIRATWEGLFPNIPFSLTYFDQFIDNMYAKEQQLVHLLSFFSIVSLVLCCMGLFAVFSLYILQKTKEISIRKVLGANVINLLKSVTRSYLLIALIAIGIAIPIASFLLSGWLDGFSYKIQMTATMFILPACVVLILSFITIAYHLRKVLNVNPADSLTQE